MQEQLSAIQWIFVRVPLLPVWVCPPMHKPGQTSDWNFEHSPRKNGTAETKSTSSLCISACSFSIYGICLCFGPLFQVSMQRFAFLNNSRSWTDVGSVFNLKRQLATGFQGRLKRVAAYEWFTSLNKNEISNHGMRQNDRMMITSDGTGVPSRMAWEGCG